MRSAVPRRVRTVTLLLLALGAVADPARAAQVDVTAGTLSYWSQPATPSVANVLTISLAGGSYTIDDPAEAAITLGSGAVGAGCAPFDNNTVTCPAAAVASIDVATTAGDDTIVLVGATAPARVTAGDGDDVFIGGAGDDTFVWNPGDDNDTVDGGPGVDVVAFNGSNVSEIVAIAPEGTGFRLSRNVASVVMSADGIERLELATAGGTDVVSTAPLAATEQVLRDGADALPDTLTVDAQGACTRLTSDASGSLFDTVGREPIRFFDFPSASVTGTECGALVDVDAGVLRYVDTAAVANRLRISIAGEDYLIDDPGEAIVTLDGSATAAGCMSIDANTAICPQSAIGSFEVATDVGDDRVDLSGVLVQTLVIGGLGDDVLTGGAVDDSFLWIVGDGSDEVDGGPGLDTLGFAGSNADDTVTIRPDGAGFVVSHDEAAVTIAVRATEKLDVATLGGEDHVRTSGLAETEQEIVDADDGVVTDTLTVDALGLCVTRLGDTFAVEGRQQIDFVRFTSVLVENACGPDPCEGAVPTQGCIVNGLRSQPCAGTPGDDSIVGTTGDDVIVGGDGSDRIRAGAGNDLVCGDAGDDSLSGGPGDDTLVGASGGDQLKGDAGNDTLLGGGGRDVLAGGTGDDELDGGDGDDRVRGLGGADTLQGGAGLDLIDGGPSTDSCADFDQAGPFPRCE
jgi:Ca2+-binding RTX toxin-like protein